MAGNIPRDRAQNSRRINSGLFSLSQLKVPTTALPRLLLAFCFTLGRGHGAFILNSWWGDRKASLIAPIALYLRREEFHDDGEIFLKTSCIFSEYIYIASLTILLETFQVVFWKHDVCFQLAVRHLLSHSSFTVSLCLPSGALLFNFAQALALDRIIAT